MTHTFHSRELQVAELAARAAGEAIRQWQQPLDEQWKGRINPVTAADKRSEALLLSHIKSAFPSDLIVSEESSPLTEEEVKGRRRWYIDPLDGTVNYSRNVPHWCVSVAYVDERDTTQTAVVYAPLSDEMFCAVRGQGAALNGSTIAVSDTDRLERAIVASGFPYSFDDPERTNLREWSAIAPRVLTVRCMGAAAKDLCEVARGRMDAFWEIELERWDTAAGALICAEAGAVVTDLDGEPLPGPSRHILVSNPMLHAPIRQLLNVAP